MSTTWRMRYRFRLAKPLSAQDEAVDFQLGQRLVTLKSRTGGPLRDARYLVCLAEDFDSEAEARAFGGRLRHALLRTSVHTRNGVDLGEDRATSVFGSSVKSRVLEQEGAALLDDVHGLMVYPDTPTPHVASLEGTGSVLFSPELFLRALAAAFDEGGVVPEELKVPVELYCASCMEPSPVAQLILAVSAIEAMVGDPPSRPDPELALIDRARQAVEQAGADRETRQRVLSTLAVSARWASGARDESSSRGISGARVRPSSRSTTAGAEWRTGTVVRTGRGPAPWRTGLRDWQPSSSRRSCPAEGTKEDGVADVGRWPPRRAWYLRWGSASNASGSGSSRATAGAWSSALGSP